MPMAPYVGPQSDLHPDVDNAWQFLEWWFEKCTSGVLEVGWMVPNIGQLTGFARFERGDISILRLIHDINTVPGQSMYIRACTIDPASPLGRTRDSDVWQSPGCWGDLDTEEQVRLARQVESMVRANAYTLTGEFPHKRYQSWLRGAEPICSPDLIRLANRKYHKLYGGDPAVVNPSRLMRLPGTISWPYKPGRVPEMTRFEIAKDRPGTYPVQTIMSMLPKVEEELGDTKAAPDNDNAGAGSGGIDSIASTIRKVQLGEQWHNNMVRVVGSWVTRGWSNAEIMLACPAITLHGYTVDQTRAEVAKAIEGARRKWSIADTVPTFETISDELQAGTALTFTPIPWDQSEGVGMRQWVYGHFLTRGFVSVLGAPGGYGKTAHAQAIALAIVTGREILGETVHEPGRVAIWNLEDPFDEMLRRFRAAALYYDVGPLEVEGRLFLNSGQDNVLVIAKLVEKGRAIPTETVEQIISQVREHNIAVLIVDPFVRSHRLTENSNDEMDLVASLWARIAKEGNCAVLLLHHFKKGGQGGDADAFRGASALVNAARAAITLTRMTSDDAARLRVENREKWRYLKVENAKLNTAPPPEDSVWLRLVSVPLHNGRMGSEGDKVQTVERWHPPSPWEALTMAEVLLILDAIEAGENGEYFTVTRRGKDADRWAGNIVYKHASQPLSDYQVVKVLNDWLQSKLLVETTYHSPKQRKVRACVRVDPTLRAKMTVTQATQGFC